MIARSIPDDLLDHLVQTTTLTRASADRVAAEVVAYFAEDTESFVCRRHRELQRAGVANAQIYTQIADELKTRPVAAPVLSERQIRRLIYG